MQEPKEYSETNFWPGHLKGEVTVFQVPLNEERLDTSPGAWLVGGPNRASQRWTLGWWIPEGVALGRRVSSWACSLLFGVAKGYGNFHNANSLADIEADFWELRFQTQRRLSAHEILPLLNMLLRTALPMTPETRAFSSTHTC